MLRRLIKKNNHNGLVIIDSQFPQKQPLGFRNVEINEYLSKIENSQAYTMYKMQPGSDAWFKHSYGMDNNQFKENLEGYLKNYPKNKHKIKHLKEGRGGYNFGLAYTFFLAETYTLLPFLEKHKIPFVFVLYPGGGFGLDLDESDKMLKRVFESKQFREVIVTQELTNQYLSTKRLCPKDKITNIYGGFVQFRKDDVRVKKYYREDKSTFDICFVAAKYTEKGVDKGYDLFIETARRLSKEIPDARFHVIGGFHQSDIDVSDFKHKIHFYNYLQADELANIYSTMDIFLGPNRPFKIYNGNFDGFPLGIDAGYCGVALFVADPLKMNHLYNNNEDIVLVSLNCEDIVKKIHHYYDRLEDLYLLSEQGQRKIQDLFSIDSQVGERIKVFSKYVNLKTERGNSL